MREVPQNGRPDVIGDAVVGAVGEVTGVACCDSSEDRRTRSSDVSNAHARFGQDARWAQAHKESAVVSIAVRSS